MKVLLVAEDLGPSKALARIALALVEQGDGVVTDFRENLSWAVHTRLHKPNVVVSGMSSVVVSGMSSSEELAGGELFTLEEAKNWRIPRALFADTFGTWGREWFKDQRDAELLFVINEEEKKKAEELFPASKIVVSGNPTWEEFFSPRFSRKEVREKLGVSNKDILFLCPGGKDLEVNRMFFLVVSLGIKEALGSSAVMVPCFHPGDKNPKEEYEDIIKSSGVRFVISSFKTDDLVAGCDCVVQSASTVGITAACQRKPVINFFSERALERLEKQTGSREWAPVEMGSEVAVYSAEKLEEKIEELFSLITSIAYKEFQKKQEKIFPCPAGGSAALIAKTLSEFVAKKKER